MLLSALSPLRSAVLVEQPGVLAGLSRRRSRVQVPSESPPSNRCPGPGLTALILWLNVANVLAGQAALAVPLHVLQCRDCWKSCRHRCALHRPTHAPKRAGA